MAKTDWKAEAKALKKKVRKLKDTLAEAAAPVVDAVQDAVGDGIAAAKKALKPVSPLAPATFPDLPVIAGAEFAAIGAGIKYQNRRDVMLVRLAPAPSWPGPSPGRPPGRPACATVRPSWRRRCRPAQARRSS